MPTITGISHIDLSAIDLDRSESFYSNLLDASRVLDGENEEHKFNSRSLLHAESLLVIGPVRHANVTVPTFDEHAVGLQKPGLLDAP